MNLPRFPHPAEARTAGMIVRLYLTRVVTTAPAVVKAFIEGLAGR